VHHGPGGGRHVVVSDELDEQLDGPPAEVVVRDRERGQAGAQPVGERGVVERDERHVGGHRETCLVECLVGAECEAVVESDDRVASAPLVDDATGGAPAIRW